MIKMGDSLYNWTNMKFIQSLGPYEDKSAIYFCAVGHLCMR